MRSAHLPPGDKSEVKKEYIASFIIEVAIQVVKKAQEHLDLATKARSYYRGQIEDAKRNVMAVFPSTPALRPGLLPRTHELTIHLSFDMAQQVRTQMNTCYHQLYNFLGSLPMRPSTTWPHVLPHTKEVCYLWHQL